MSGICVLLAIAACTHTLCGANAIGPASNAQGDAGVPLAASLNASISVSDAVSIDAPQLMAAGAMRTANIRALAAVVADLQLLRDGMSASHGMTADTSSKPTAVPAISAPALRALRDLYVLLQAVTPLRTGLRALQSLLTMRTEYERTVQVRERQQIARWLAIGTLRRSAGLLAVPATLESFLAPPLQIELPLQAAALLSDSDRALLEGGSAGVRATSNHTTASNGSSGDGSGMGKAAARSAVPSITVLTGPCAAVAQAVARGPAPPALTAALRCVRALASAVDALPEGVMLRRIAVHRSEDSAGLPLRHGNSSLAQLLASPLSTSHVHAQAPGVASFWRRHLHLNASSCLNASVADAERTWGSLAGTASKGAAAGNRPGSSSADSSSSSSSKPIVAPARACLLLDAQSSPAHVRRGQDAMLSLMASLGIVPPSGAQGNTMPAPALSSSRQRESRTARQLARDVRSGRVGVVSWLLNSRNADERSFRLRYAAARIAGIVLLPARIAWDAAAAVLHVSAVALDWIADAAAIVTSWSTPRHAGAAVGMGSGSSATPGTLVMTSSASCADAPSGYFGLGAALEVDGSSSASCAAGKRSSGRVQPGLTSLAAALGEAWWTCACDHAATMLAAARATAGAAWSAAAGLAPRARDLLVGSASEHGLRARVWRRAEQLLTRLPDTLAALPGNIASDVVDPLLTSLRRSSLPWMAAAAWDTAPWLVGLVFPPSERGYTRPEIVALQRMSVLLDAMIAQADALADAATGIAQRALLHPPLQHWRIKALTANPGHGHGSAGDGTDASSSTKSSASLDGDTGDVSIIFEARDVDLSIWQTPPASALRAAAQGGNTSVGETWGSAPNGTAHQALDNAQPSSSGSRGGGAVAMLWPQPFHWLAGTGSPAVGQRQLAALARARYAWEALLAACFSLPRLPLHSAGSNAKAGASADGWVLCPGFGILRRSTSSSARSGTSSVSSSVNGAANVTMSVVYQWNGTEPSLLCTARSAGHSDPPQDTLDSQGASPTAAAVAAESVRVRLACSHGGIDARSSGSSNRAQQSEQASTIAMADLRSALRFSPQMLCYSLSAHAVGGSESLPQRVCFPLACSNAKAVSIAELAIRLPGPIQDEQHAAELTAAQWLGQAGLAATDAPQATAGAALTSVGVDGVTSSLPALLHTGSSVWALSTPAACPALDPAVEESLHAMMGPSGAAGQ